MTSACLYCSTSGWAFGPLFRGDSRHDAAERAEAFLRWIPPLNPRRMSDDELTRAYRAWLAQEPAQWEAEETENLCPVCKEAHITRLDGSICEDCAREEHPGDDEEYRRWQRE